MSMREWRFLRGLSVVMGALVMVGCQALGPQNGPVTDSFQELLDGNQRFVNNDARHPHADPKWRHENATHGQHPWATVISCSDSRVPIEMVFDAGLGDLFVVRVAGNVVDADETGSVEYAVEHLHTPLIAVIGHEQCGAVTAVVKKAVAAGDIPRLVEHIRPAVMKVSESHPGLSDEELLHLSVRENVIHTMRDLTNRSEAVREAVKAGKLKVRGGVYDLDTGKVNWIEADVLKPEPVDESHDREQHAGNESHGRDILGG